MADIGLNSVWKCEFWGEFAVWSPDGASVTPRGRKARALLAWLALHPGRPVSRERLCGLLWGDRAEEQARGSLRQALFELKPFATGPAPLLRVERAQLTLDPQRLATDLGAAPPEPGLPAHQDPFLADLDDIDEAFDDWLRVERQRQAALREAGSPVPAAAAPPPFAATPVAATAPVAAAPAERAERATAPAPAPPRRRLARTLALVAAAVVALALALAALRPWQGDAPRPTLAVLPIAAAGAGVDPAVAEGIVADLIDLLAQYPGLEVLGVGSTRALTGQAADPRQAGRRLGVDWLLDTRIAAAPGGQRMTVGLIRSRDGARVWSAEFGGGDAGLPILLPRIADSVADALALSERRPLAAPIATAADVYRDFLAARAGIRSFMPERVTAGVAQMREVVRRAPGHAPAWSALGLGLWYEGEFVAGPNRKAELTAQAHAATRRALELDPFDPTALYVRSFLASSTAESRRYLLMAARAHPRNAEVWNALSQLELMDGRFAEALEAKRRAVAIDPLWWVAFYFAADLAFEMGHPDEEQAYVRRVTLSEPPGSYLARMVAGDSAYRRADWSEAWRQGRLALAAARPAERRHAGQQMARALRAAGFAAEARTAWSHYPMDETMWNLWHLRPPPPAEVARMIGDPETFWTDTPRAQLVLQSLVAAGRTAEAVALYDRRFPTPEAMAEGHPAGWTFFVADAPAVVLALRAERRDADAARLLALALASSTERERRGPVPHWFHLQRARLLAVAGQPAQSIAALERAERAGMPFQHAWQPLDFLGEPALKPLAGNPRFEALRRRQAAHQAREHREILALKQAALPI